MSKIRIFILRAYKGLERCPYCGSDVPEGFEEKVKTIELEPLLDLLEERNDAPDWDNNEIYRRIQDFLRENGRMK